MQAMQYEFTLPDGTPLHRDYQGPGPAETKKSPAHLHGGGE